MDVTKHESQLQQVLKLNEELRLQNASLVEALTQLRHDHEALLDSTQAVKEDRDKLQQRVVELEAANRRLVDMLWGRRTERRTISPDQLCLDFGFDADGSLGEDEQAAITAAEQAEMEFDEDLLRRLQSQRQGRKKGQRRTQEFPPHLERRERVFDLSEGEKDGLKYIGDAVTERMRFEKPHVYIERIVRRKYVVENQPERGVLSPAPPLAILEGCKYDFSVVAAIVAGKFAFHNPTYRQQDWFAQSGWFPNRSTINDLINASVATIGPLFEQMWHLLLQPSILLSDDTRLLLLTRNALSEEQQELLRGRRRSGLPPGGVGPPAADGRGSVTSYAWLYTGLEDLAPYNIFHWSLTHQHAVVDAHLANFRGTLVGDAFSGYTQIGQRSEGRIVHASCNAHARREFVEAETSEPILCAQALSFYRQLYEVEERGKTLDAAGRLALRQRDAVPVWNRFGVWLASEKVQRVLPRSRFGQAVGYLQNQWTSLQRYLMDGRIPIDNDLSEQIIRSLTTGRKNWLFLGHPQAAAGRLRLMSIVSSAMRHHLVVHDYLEDILAKLADATQHHPHDLRLGSEYLMDLLPDRWAAAHPKSIRHERIAENNVVSETKRARRARRRIEASRQAASSR